MYNRQKCERRHFLIPMRTRLVTLRLVLVTEAQSSNVTLTSSLLRRVSQLLQKQKPDIEGDDLNPFYLMTCSNPSVNQNIQSFPSF